MLTAALALAVVVFGVALAVAVRMWRDATRHVAEQAQLIRHQCGQISRAELDALSIAGPHPATLTPDDPSLLPDEVERWLRDRTPTIRPAFPEES